VSFDGGGDVLEYVAISNATGFDGREHPLHETTALRAQSTGVSGVSIFFCFPL
jgi:hypothetical protein